MDTNGAVDWDVYADNCPTRKILDRIADKWTVLIVGRLATSKRRFGELRREICGISPKVLTQKLRELERDGIVVRRVYATVPPKVEYSLTPLGHTLTELLDAIRVWSETHIEAILEAQQVFDSQAGAEEAEEI
jgi:DNA-binding HxlR family transcriptional regulator